MRNACSHNSGKTWRNENLKKRVVGKQGPDNKVKSWNTIGSDSLLSELRITGVKKTYFYQDSKTIFSNAIVNQILTLHSHADNEKELKFHST